MWERVLFIQVEEMVKLPDHNIRREFDVLCYYLIRVFISYVFPHVLQQVQDLVTLKNKHYVHLKTCCLEVIFFCVATDSQHENCFRKKTRHKVVTSKRTCENNVATFKELKRVFPVFRTQKNLASWSLYMLSRVTCRLSFWTWVTWLLQFDFLPGSWWLDLPRLTWPYFKSV